MSKPGIGHNSGDNISATANGDAAVPAGGIAVERLRSIVERIERLEEERKAISGDIRDIYLEAKSAGFNVKALRRIVALRRREATEVEEEESAMDVYRHALGI